MLCSQDITTYLMVKEPHLASRTRARRSFRPASAPLASPRRQRPCSPRPEPLASLGRSSSRSTQRRASASTARGRAASRCCSTSQCGSGPPPDANISPGRCCRSCSCSCCAAVSVPLVGLAGRRRTCSSCSTASRPAARTWPSWPRRQRASGSRASVRDAIEPSPVPHACISWRVPLQGGRRSA